MLPVQADVEFRMNPDISGNLDGRALSSFILNCERVFSGKDIDQLKRRPNGSRIGLTVFSDTVRCREYSSIIYERRDASSGCRQVLLRFSDGLELSGRHQGTRTDSK